MSQMPPFLSLLERLIATPSISCTDPRLDQSNLPVIEQLADWCEAIGMKVEILPVPGHANKANLMATLGSGSGGLVLAGHTDTVPYDAQRWQHDPFKLIEADQRLYGLGTSDMKSFFAMVLEAIRPLKDKIWQQPLILLATADEETSMSGAQALVNAGLPKARYALIGEPTGLRPARSHKGIMMEAIRLHGQAGHSSDPSLGNSALEGMHSVIGALLRWRTELQARYQNPLFTVPVPTLNLGHIHGGDNPNRICGDCELQIDLRPLPGMSIIELRAQLLEKVQQAVADTGLRVELESLFSGIEAMETPAQSALVQTVEKLSGHTSQAVAFATEAPYLNSLGMDTVVLGPGYIEQAHQPDEFLALDNIAPMLTLLTQLIAHFCLTSHESVQSPII